MRNRLVILTLSVFFLCLGVRIYCLSEKSILEGDELTSLTLAYNNTGYGDNTYISGHIYTASELKRNLYLDDTGGVAGYASDIKSLWSDNRDPSHASLYYMLLRTALLGVGFPAIKETILWGCGLNILLFVITFFLILSAARRLLGKDSPAVSLVLLLAFMSPLSISNTMLLREYQLAECMAALFFLVLISLVDRIKSDTDILTFKDTAITSLVSAALVSSGYFNTFLIILSCAYVVCISYRNRRLKGTLIFIAVTATAAILLAKLMYNGFFNFLTDVRTSEVMDKAEGLNFASNLTHSLKFCLAFVCLDILNPIVIAVSIVYLMKDKTFLKHFRKVQYQYLIITGCWTALIMFFTTWKIPQYIAPCASLLCLSFALLFKDVNLKKHILPTSLIFLAISIYPFLATSIYPVASLRRLHVYPTVSKDFKWPEAGTLYLYAPGDDKEERHTLTLLIPYLHDNQRCVILNSTAQIEETARLSRQDKIYVFGYSFRELKELPCFLSSYRFNNWQDIYEYAAG